MGWTMGEEGCCHARVEWWSGGLNGSVHFECSPSRCNIVILGKREGCSLGSVIENNDSHDWVGTEIYIASAVVLHIVVS